MGLIFKKEPKPNVSIASPPEVAETPGEIKHMGESQVVQQQQPQPEFVEIKPQPEPRVEKKPEVEYKEVPICLSQSQINNLVIENNIMLKQIIAEIK